MTHLGSELLRRSQMLFIFLVVCCIRQLDSVAATVTAPGRFLLPLLHAITPLLHAVCDGFAKVPAIPRSSAAIAAIYLGHATQLPADEDERPHQTEYENG